MHYEELKEQVKAAPAAKAKDFRELLSLTSIAGGVWPQFENHLAEANDFRSFFRAIYHDDACRFENAWAYWAKMNRESWVDRFEADRVVRGVLLDTRGIFLKGGGNELLIPLAGRSQAIDVYLFRENGFNEKAAEFYGAIEGSFTCVGLELEGAFDVFRTHRGLIFERWEVDKLNRRADGKGQIHVEGDCCTPW